MSAAAVEWWKRPAAAPDAEPAGAQDKGKGARRATRQQADAPAPKKGHVDTPATAQKRRPHADAKKHPDAAMGPDECAPAPRPTRAPRRRGGAERRRAMARRRARRRARRPVRARASASERARASESADSTGGGTRRVQSVRGGGTRRVRSVREGRGGGRDVSALYGREVGRGSVKRAPPRPHVPPTRAPAPPLVLIGHAASFTPY